ncbi:hypothetical protein AO882_32890, partial [Pseudomonas paraeruginosa]
MVGDGLEQRVELAHAQAFALIGGQQFVAGALRQVLGAFELDAADVETTAVTSGSAWRRGRFVTWQLLEFLQALALLVQQALLAL